MTWSYDPEVLNAVDGDNNPTAAAKRNQVRLLIRDHDVDGEHYIEDEEIDFLVSQWWPVKGTTYWVASVAAENIAASFAPEASYSADGVSIGLGAVAQQFRDLAAALRAQHSALLTGGGPDVGGIAPGEETAPDIAPFDFGTGMHDNIEAGRQSYGSRPKDFSGVFEE